MILIYILLFLFVLPIILFVLISSFLPFFLRAKLNKMTRRSHQDEEEEVSEENDGSKYRDSLRFNSDNVGEYTNFEDIDDSTEEKR